MYKEKLEAYMKRHREEIVETLKSLVRIPSVEGSPEAGAPFGRACADILRKTEALYAENGFLTEMHGESGYLLASGGGSGEKTIGLFAHGDVVPVSDDWVMTDPFTPIERDGFLIGRGVEDNKSGIVASLFAMRAIRDLGIPVKSRIVAFTGANEESGMCDIEAFARDERMPELSLVADCAFPVYRGEKGVFRYVSKLCGNTGLSIQFDFLIRYSLDHLFNGSKKLILFLFHRGIGKKRIGKNIKKGEKGEYRQNPLQVFIHKKFPP